MITFKYKIFAPRPPAVAIDTLGDWQGQDFLLLEYTEDLQEALAQPYKIAAVPVGYNTPEHFSFSSALSEIDFSKFDLVILSEIEHLPLDQIIEHTLTAINNPNYLLAVGCFEFDLPDNIIYRPWWIFRHMDLNGETKRQINNDSKEFLFEALLGQKRPHRSFVMAKFQQNPDLLSRSIVTYRNVFGQDSSAGPHVMLLPEAMSEMLGGNELLWPYVSPNLNSDWEVENPYGNGINNQISEITPWKIYDKTWYSIVCETLWHNPAPNVHNPGIDSPGPFFLSEKIAKVMLGHRLFVMFGQMHILKFLREQGFKTFDSIIDESYDNCDNIVERFTKAFEQIEYLATCDPVDVMQKTEAIRRHNWQHLYEYRTIRKNQMASLIFNRIPDQHLYDSPSKLPELKEDQLIRTQWGGVDK